MLARTVKTFRFYDPLLPIIRHPDMLHTDRPWNSKQQPAPSLEFSRTAF